MRTRELCYPQIKWTLESKHIVGHLCIKGNVQYKKSIRESKTFVIIVILFFFFDPFPKRTIFQHAIKQQKKINDLAIIMICILCRVFATVTT